jgi:hypothetical protein
MSEELALALAQQEQQEVDLQLERDKRLSVALQQQFAMEFDAEEKERKKKLQEMVKNDERYMMQLAAEEEAGTNAAQSVPSHPTPAEPGPAAAPAAAVAEPIQMRKRLPGHRETAPEDGMMTACKRRKKVSKNAAKGGESTSSGGGGGGGGGGRSTALPPPLPPLASGEAVLRPPAPPPPPPPPQHEPIPRPQHICPISKAAMIDPVVAADGHSYERECIERWLTIYSNTSPMTNLVLQNTVLIPNHALRQEIEDAQVAL